MKLAPTVEELAQVMTEDLGMSHATVIRFVLKRRERAARAELAALEKSLRPKKEKGHDKTAKT
jgi:hypothetical protein